MEYLVYISTAKRMLDEDELTEILTVSRKKNEKHGITGVLLYSQGAFLHLLEGEAEDISRAFNAITIDERHKNVIKLAHDELAQRFFDQWFMGFKLNDFEKINNIEGYLNPANWKFEKCAEHPGMEILKTFIDSH